MSRKLDALIAEKVMEYECVCDEETTDCPIHAYGDYSTLRPYSASLGIAWRVVDKMFEIDDQEIYLAFRHFIYAMGGVSPSHVMPERICLAALRAVGVPEAEIQEALNE